MDSYDLFGEDGAGMLEGLPELGSGDHFEPTVTASRDANSSFPQQQQQPLYSTHQENPLQKLASFGASDFSHMDPNVQNMYPQGYGTDRPMGPPGGMGDSAAMQTGWGQHSGYPAMHRYSQMGGYRQQTMGYGHQQDQKQQFPATQHPMMQQPHQSGYPMQQRHTPHYPTQASTYPGTATQGYGGYMHQRMPHHHQYSQTHHQLDMGTSQSQQYTHMGHGQALGTHTTSHTAPTPGHIPPTHPANQVHAPTNQQSTAQNHMTHPTSMGYGQTPHQPMQPTLQRSMEAPQTNQQQYAPKHATGNLGNASPQYRAPFPQLSPQLSSPRPQMSPRPPAPQMSPRPVMSPAKPNLSPHPQMQQQTLSPRPPATITPISTTASPTPMPPYSQQSTLQALELMVMPNVSSNSTEYPPYQSRSSIGLPSGSHPSSANMRNPMTDQWTPHQQRTPHIPNMSSGLNLMDAIPTSQGLPPTQNLPHSNTLPTSLQQNTQNLGVGFGGEEPRTENIPKHTSVSDSSIPIATTPAASTKNELAAQSPASSNGLDKPSSTTNNMEMNAPSVSQSSSHPSTPVPSSTTDDNIPLNQETSLPPNTESIKSMEDNSNSNSSNLVQATHHSSTTNSFTDFSSVSSITSYTNQKSHHVKTNMDDLMPSYNQDCPISKDSTTPKLQNSPAPQSQSHLTSISSPQSQSSLNVPTSSPYGSLHSTATSQNLNMMSHGLSSNQIDPGHTNQYSVGHFTQSSNTISSNSMSPGIQNLHPGLQQMQNQQIPHSLSSTPTSISSSQSITSIDQMISKSQSNLVNNAATPGHQQLTSTSQNSVTPPIQTPQSINNQSQISSGQIQPSQPQQSTEQQLNQSSHASLTQVSSGQLPHTQMAPNQIPSGQTQPTQQIQPPQPSTGQVPPDQSQSGQIIAGQLPPVPGPIAQTNQTPVTGPIHSNQNSSLQTANISHHPNLTSMAHAQTPTMYDQNSSMIGPNGLPLSTSRGLTSGMPPHVMPLNHAGLPMGLSNSPNVVSSMGPGHTILPNQDMGYQPPISHHQERAALQQQLQELYCMPPASENQDKIAHLQERLSILAQHEATDQCNGGPQCVLQSPLFTSPMIDSPQVTSTTGRGRSKGTPRTKKPRQKKSDKEVPPVQTIPRSGTPPINNMVMHQPPQTPLPVSEDCVTAGAGLTISNNEINDLGADPITDENDFESQKKIKGTKKREPKKTKEPKEPKKPKEPKTPKEKKKKEPKEPKDSKTKRKYIRKKKSDDDTGSATEESFNKSLDSGGEENLPMPSDVFEPSEPNKSAEEKKESVEVGDNLPESTEDTECMQADSSQTLTENALDENVESESKKDEYNFEDQSSSNEAEIEKFKRIPKRSRPTVKKVVSSKARSSRNSNRSRKRKGQMQLMDSDGEEDLAATPPPSPPDDPESATHKRRSARNTQRKKYIDDVMLRFSDDESPATSKSKKSSITTPPAPNSQPSTPIMPKDSDKETETPSAETANKPNFVYVNTTDEDAMVVQYVLASRMAKREKKISELNKEEVQDKKDDEVKEEDQPESIEKEDKKEEEDEDNKEKEENVEQTEKTENIETDNIKNETVVQEIVTMDVEEYYVKYRNFSYLHCEWRTEEELYKGDKRISNKIKRFKQKQQQQMNIFESLDEEPFNPDYMEVDRVLDVAEHTDPNTQEKIKHYLVKWRALQYEDSTWELEEDVDPLKIQQFEKHRALPPKEKWKPKKRPHPDSWVKMEKSPVYKGENVLREYQLEGLNWLLFSWYNGRNCILADEMGLGKTIQSLTFIHAVHEHGIRGPFLIIAPLSTIPNWQREIESWTDMNVVVYHGSSASRNMIQEYEMFYKSEKGQIIKDLTKFNILITTFEIIVTDFAELKGFNWRLCIIDEAHRLKNRNCKLLEGLRQLTLEHRVLLSGTPLQNNVNELFSLLNFLEPAQFPSNDAFLQEFGQLKTEQEVSKLQCVLKPMMLRRLKEDVEKSLAPKEETVVEVELTNIQKKYYRGILERNFSFLQKGTTHANIPNLMNTMMELRKCCIHPYLLNGAEDQIQYDFKVQHGEDPDAYYKALINSSGKMVLIDKLLPKLKANGHRVLIFSQMVRCLDILEDYLMYKKYSFERIDGRIRGNLRQAAIDRFSRPDSDRFVFLLCTKAGGLGINLTAADTVIIYDSDWNPQNDLQAQARCHRIGQQKMVKIYRLLCRNTYEREMFDKASLKLGLDKAILQSMNTSQGGKDSSNRQLSKKEIEDLLKKGAYGALLDEENDGDKFCEEDIDMILARRTQVITMESEKGSTFSKASFASSANRSDINIDDPDFWNKWAKKAEIDTTEKDETEELVLSEPRRRTQIKRYGHEDNAIDMSELESSSDSDADGEGMSLGLRGRRNKKLKKKVRIDDYIPREGERGEIVYGSWARRECFVVERGLLTFGWGRWKEILDHSQLRKGWKESDIEDCARVILLYCLRFYRGDEKIRSFIWDLITPSENGEELKITRNHHGLKDPVPRGIRNKNKKKKENRHAALTDPNHWSKSEKYDGDIFLENNYKKHLGRHANKVLLRVRMLYYIKHEIIGDLVQHIADGVHVSALPINPPVTEQLPCEWWDAECDKSLLVGTWKHGYENYTEMRADPTLCFLSRCGPPSARELQLASNMQPPTPALNEDDLDDDDAAEESSIKSIKNRDVSEVNSEGAEPSPGPSASSETVPSEPTDEKNFEDGDDKLMWPGVTDLNTRLRRVITSYQRNYRKEEQQKMTTKPKYNFMQPANLENALSSPLAALAQVSQQLEHRDSPSLTMPGWDLQQLALYLLKMERQGKQLEQVSRDKERQTISKRWTKREEADFFRVVSSYGVNYYRKKKAYDWTKFKQLSKLEKKSDDELTEYYKSFVVMCKKQTGAKVDEETYDTTIEHINEEKARRTLERLELLSRIREEVVTHPKLDERLKVCQTSADMPEWWVPGKHDKDLLLGVAKHGLGRTDYYILNDPELSFQEILRKKVGNCVESSENKDAIKLESHEDILKFDKNEILVKLEKGEGTLKIEKVNVKKDLPEDKEKKKEENKIELKLVKNESIEGEKDSEEKEEKPKEEKESKENEEKHSEGEESVSDAPKKTETEEQTKKDNKVDVTTAGDHEKPPAKQDQFEKVSKKEETDADLCAKQAAELKAMFPDLEVIQPLSRLSQIDTFVLQDKQGTGALDFSETTVAQLFNNAVKWPREYALQVRLQHIIYAIETKEWPASKTFSAYANGIGPEFDVPIHEVPNEPPPKRETSTPMSSVGDSEIITITTDSLNRNNANSKKRKRHIAIDVETERAKLHALLNSSHGNLASVKTTTGNAASSTWADNDDSEDSRRSTPISQHLQPPPAHQQTTRVLSMPYDLKYHTPKTIGQTSVIPGTSSTLTPIDLSSGMPKTNLLEVQKTSNSTSQDIQNEVQDFSLKKNVNPSTSLTAPTLKSSGNKLDDTLFKLMKRKNCPIEEPVVGKEKKRRKLDEIVLGLSAAKEQSLFPETSKKPSISPSVTVTPTSAPLSTSHAPPVSQQKPFSITVTSLPSPAAQRNTGTPNLKSPLSTSLSSTLTKDSFQSFLAQAEQQNFLLKKHQQQQQKSYEAMITDMNKVADFSSKINSYSHEAKVNKWLAEQNVAAAVAEQPFVADYLSAPRRRRPRVDPSLLDWKKLTGDENVSVIHRVTGKKLTGPKAPTLKRLGQWLMENPMYDIDPKWSELVKERGNLSHDLQKRLPAQQKKSAPGRPPMLSSPSGSNTNLQSSMSSALQFPSLAGLNPNLLSGLSGLGQFDPKNPLFDPKNNPLFDPKNNPLFDPKNSSLFDPKNSPLFDPKNSPLFDPKNPLFDPKNNPLFDPKNTLLMPFAAGMPNVNALNSMAGLGNLGNMNLFANLAGLGLPNLAGLDPVTLAATDPTKVKSSSGSSSEKNKMQKPMEAHGGGGGNSSSNKPSASSGGGGGAGGGGGSLPTSSPFPFFFPNPSLLYTPLGLGGLNPFALQPGMTAAYDTLAQQCGLLNGSLGSTAASPSSHGKSKQPPSSTSAGSSSKGPSVTSTATISSSHSTAKSPRPRSDTQLHNLLLPPDTQLLESISKVAGNLDASIKQQMKLDRRDEKQKAFDNQQKTLEHLRGMLPTDFMMAPDKLKGMKDIPTFADFSKFLEVSQHLSGGPSMAAAVVPSKKSREQEMKEALEKLSKNNSELLARTVPDEQQRLMPSSSNKRQRESVPKEVPENLSYSKEDDLNPSKRLKESRDRETPNLPTMVAVSSASSTLLPPTTMATAVDIETLLPPSTVVKCSPGSSPVKDDNKQSENAIPQNLEDSQQQLQQSADTKLSESENTETAALPPPSSSSQSPPLSQIDGTISKTSEDKEQSSETQQRSNETGANEATETPAKGKKRTRGKRRSGEIILDPEGVIERKNLRSSASRSAAIAAARAASAEQKQLEAAAENAQKNQEQNDAS
ncbi:chromodomain-helicase-DNA-binding protein 7 isoform X3 [Agrilus planipennis]|uniref:Chromodomain-helicase-DNA-binding protein 7 isoform X3 n=1 Tax=Agrilus planipennis TaxID=224129 RepID=A0A7F5RAK9_AGRPL|nr:chromodomain-helicase-DNA-binding protein 7 isoform X3 [Agrilus planipennis]